jgi:sugar/nucleoside kinase (ribokinase family)
MAGRTSHMSIDPAMFAGSSLFVAGNINRDIKAAPLGAATRLFDDGETSVPWIVETVGGGGANSACAAVALGARVAFAGKVGHDSIAETLKQALVRHGVVPYLSIDAHTRTGSSIALSFETGRRHFVSSLPNNESLGFEDLDLSSLSDYGHLYRADIWFSEPMLYGGNVRLFRAARDDGVPVSIDINWDPKWGRASHEEIGRRKEAVRDALEWVDLAHGNARELQEFTATTQLTDALRILEQWGAGAIVVHMGRDGAGYYSRGELCTAPAFPARAQVNTTGTGDVLSVCMMLLHHRGEIPVVEKLRAANRIVAGFIEGDTELIPTL